MSHIVATALFGVLTAIGCYILTDGHFPRAFFASQFINLGVMLYVRSLT